MTFTISLILQMTLHAVHVCIIIPINPLRTFTTTCRVHTVSNDRNHFAGSFTSVVRSSYKRMSVKSSVAILEIPLVLVILMWSLTKKGPA